MKIKDIASYYRIDAIEFERFLNMNNLPYTATFKGPDVDADKVEIYVYRFCHQDKSPHLSDEDIKERVSEEKAVDAIEEARKKQAMAEMLITSGFNFDGYRIVKYSGYISGDDAISVDRGSAWSEVSVRDKLMASLVRIRRNALRELKEAAYDLGCNAVIGVDFDYLTLDPETARSGHTVYQPYVFCVTANGNAVIIEKVKDDKPE